MSTIPMNCVVRDLQLISIEEQNLTEVYGGGGEAKIFNGYGKIVVEPIRSQNRQKQTVWFKDSSGRELSRTLYNVGLQGRPGHQVVEYELQTPGRESKPFRYINKSTGITYQVYVPYDLGIEWGVLQRPWEHTPAHLMIGAILGFFLNIPFAWLLMQMSAGLGIASFVLGGPVLGAIGLPALMHSQINEGRFARYSAFEKSVNEALSKASAV